MSGLNLKPTLIGYSSGMEKSLTDEAEDQVDAFVARNREAIEASILQGRKDLAEGKVSTRTIDEIVAEIRAR